jgi:hypothetical protein
MEKSGEGGRTTDEVTSRNGEAVLVAGSQFSQHGGEVLSSTGIDAVGSPSVLRLDVTVIVVERQQLKIDQLAGWVILLGGRRVRS